MPCIIICMHTVHPPSETWEQTHHDNTYHLITITLSINKPCLSRNWSRKDFELINLYYVTSPCGISLFLSYILYPKLFVCHPSIHAWDVITQKGKRNGQGSGSASWRWWSFILGSSSKERKELPSLMMAEEIFTYRFFVYYSQHCLYSKHQLGLFFSKCLKYMDFYYATV